MTDCTLSFELIWQGFTIDVRFVPNWLSTGHDHIELRCRDPLPVPQTGYCSRFVPAGTVSCAEDLRAMLQSWLDDAATSPNWLAYLENSRQMKLF